MVPSSSVAHTLRSGGGPGSETEHAILVNYSQRVPSSRADKGRELGPLMKALREWGSRQKV